MPEPPLAQYPTRVSGPWRVQDRPRGEGPLIAEVRELARRVAHLQRAVESVEHALRAETADLSARLTLLQRQVDALEERIARLPPA